MGALLAGVLLVGALAGCGAGAEPAGDAAPGEATTRPTTGTSAAPVAPAANFCQVPLPAAWRKALRSGALPQRAGESLIVHAVGNDGHTAIVDSRAGAGRTVEFVHDGARRDVLRLAKPETDQLYGAAYDGRYLVFSVSHDPSNLSDWTLYAWDSRTRGAPRVLASNAVDADGHPVDSPMLYPVVAGGHAAWTAGTPDGGDELHRYTFASDSDQVVRAGHPGAPFLLGAGDHGLDLVWPESARPDALTELHAVDLPTGRPAALPAPLAGIRGPAFIAGGPTGTLAWVSSDARGLSVWHAGWAKPVRVLSVPEGRNLQWVRVAGNLVTWDDGAAQWAADLRTGAYTRLTSSYGYTVAGGASLAVGYAPTRKAGAATAPSVVDADTLPALPACR